ncbi:MAG: DUF3618 domain-containing protein [Pseudonocardia sp.]
MTAPQETPRPTPRRLDHPNPVAERPVVDTRDPDVLRTELDERRRALGDTVEELAHRADVPARMRDRKDETVTRVREGAAQTGQTVREQPAALLVTAGAVVGFLLIRARRRRRARRSEEQR